MRICHVSKNIKRVLTHSEGSGPGSTFTVIQLLTPLLLRSQRAPHAGTVPKLRISCVSQVGELISRIHRKWEVQVAETTPAPGGVVEMWPGKLSALLPGLHSHVSWCISPSAYSSASSLGGPKHRPLKTRQRKVFQWSFHQEFNKFEQQWDKPHCKWDKTRVLQQAIIIQGKRTFSPLSPSPPVPLSLLKLWSYLLSNHLALGESPAHCLYFTINKEATPSAPGLCKGWDDSSHVSAGPNHGSSPHSGLAPLAKCFPISESGEASIQGQDL